MRVRPAGRVPESEVDLLATDNVTCSCQGLMIIPESHDCGLNRDSIVLHSTTLLTKLLHNSNILALSCAVSMSCARLLCHSGLTLQT